MFCITPTLCPKPKIPGPQLSPRKPAQPLITLHRPPKTPAFLHFPILSRTNICHPRLKLHHRHARRQALFRLAPAENDHRFGEAFTDCIPLQSKPGQGPASKQYPQLGQTSELAFFLVPSLGAGGSGVTTGSGLTVAGDAIGNGEGQMIRLWEEKRWTVKPETFRRRLRMK